MYVLHGDVSTNLIKKGILLDSLYYYSYVLMVNIQTVVAKLTNHQSSSYISGSVLPYKSSLHPSCLGLLETI